MMQIPSFSNFSSPIDDDRSLSDAFSSLNLSPAMYGDVPAFAQEVYGGYLGSGDEGFAHRMMHLEGFRRRLGDLEGFRRHCSSGFDFDFDQKSRIGDMMIPNCSSSNLASVIPDNNKKLKFQRLDDYEQVNPSCSSNQYQHCGVGLTNFQSQSQNYNVNHDNEVMSLWSLKKLRGRIYTMAKDQNGCRLLQALFERPTMEEIEIVLNEVVGFVSDLMKDQFGNYLIQKLVVVCNDGQKMQLILSLCKDIVHVCMNPHGYVKLFEF